MKDILALLNKFGLMEKEAKTYLALLSLGPSTVGQIAKKAELKRPTLYLVLEELRKKELLLKVPHPKKAIYQAKSPEEIYNQAIDNIRELETNLPQLKSFQVENKDIKTLYYEGIEEIESALRYKIDKLRGTEIFAFLSKGGTKEANKRFFETNKKWTKELKDFDIKIKGITPETEKTKILKKEYLLEYKEISLIPEKEYSSNISIEITDLFIRIIDLQGEQAIIVENKEVVKAFKDIYKLTQKGLKKK